MFLFQMEDIIKKLKKTKVIFKTNKNGEPPFTIMEDCMQNGEIFLRCKLCMAIMRPVDHPGISGHLNGNKHQK